MCMEELFALNCQFKHHKSEGEGFGEIWDRIKMATNHNRTADF